MKTKQLAILAFIIISTVLAWPITCRGQIASTEYRLSGKVADSTSQQALEFVTVSLISDSSQTMKADYSKADGSFLLADIKPGVYSLVLTMVGYKTVIMPIILNDSVGMGRDLGVVLLVPQAIGLTEVLVKAARPIVTQQIDRLTYDLQADPDSKVYNALEMMRKVPFLSLDGDENILLKGSRNYRVFINGRPSGLVERNPKDVLRTMPASSIVRIEVITNPPAKYDAEGMAGIINIVTSKSLENGVKGSITLSERFPVGGPGLGGSVSAQRGKLGISVLGGASLYRIPLTDNELDRVTPGPEPTMLNQAGKRRSRQRSGYLGYEVSYEINDRHLLTGQLNINGSRTRATVSQRSLLDAGALQGYDLNAANALSGSSFDAAFNYQLGFKAGKDRLLTISYRYYGYDDDQHDQVALTNRRNYESPDYQQLNDQRFDEQSFQLDYVSPVKKVNAEIGLKAILRRNNSNFEYRSFNDGQFEMDPDLSNRFSYNQDVLSAYNSYEYALGNWGLRAGVRVEQTLIKADFLSTNSTVAQRYTNVIPSLAVSRKLKNNGMVKIGFVRQISRPSIQRLNPFVDRSNPNVETSGNPNLRPYTFNRIQLSYGVSAKVSLNLGLDYTFVRNIDFRITRFDSSANISRSTYENTGSGDAVDFSLSTRYPVTKNWDINVNGMLTFISAAVGNPPSRISTRIVQYNVTLSTAYRLGKGWRINASLNPVSRSFRSPQEKANGLLASSFGVTKEIIEGKLSLSVMVANPFTTYRTNAVRAVGTTFTQYRSSRDYFRSFNINLTYNFGRLKDAIKKNKRGIKNDDINK
ncbi:TonB-dependent receptor [Dyadobacter sp. CY261]|uniref:outer membrane beta-barrel family protein n=1 Tax=Dyadobacter sp. CY261 TaxID=2907203 RepID=UPI001F474383|nr:outer membrane beta-barrel family protein [Dyadobacter sp. CY261]MCF0072844.1 TonB-dependent receptor [Dyadobacter sp. CY261]